MCTYVCACLCVTWMGNTHQIPIMFVSEEVEKGSREAKGTVHFIRHFFLLSLQIIKNKNVSSFWLWILAVQVSVLFYTFLQFLKTQKPSYCICRYSTCFCNSGSPMYWLHHLRLFQSRQLHFSPWILAFHLGIISELTYIHYPECITCLFLLPETLALQPMVRAGKCSVLPHLITRTHPYFILRLHSVYQPPPQHTASLRDWGEIHQGLSDIFIHGPREKMISFPLYPSHFQTMPLSWPPHQAHTVQEDSGIRAKKAPLCFRQIRLSQCVHRGSL